MSIPTKSKKLCARYDLPEAVAKLLVGRGVTEEEIEGFLNPTLKNNFPDPFSMQGMADMAAYMAQSIMGRALYCCFR